MYVNQQTQHNVFRLNLQKYVYETKLASPKFDLTQLFENEATRNAAIPEMGSYSVIPDMLLGFTNFPLVPLRRERLHGAKFVV